MLAHKTHHEQPRKGGQVPYTAHPLVLEDGDGDGDDEAIAALLHDTAVAESFFATLKIELVYRSTWPTRGAVRRATFEFIEVFYNRRRLHSTLGYWSPAEYEAAMPSRASSTSAA